MKEMNAPALAGREDWYLIRQMQNFKDGVRGKDPADTYGLQMAPMAQLLADRQAIEDVAAYLSNLDKK
jgi:cytochrome c oxidase subunit 2